MEWVIGPVHLQFTCWFSLSLHRQHFCERKSLAETGRRVTGAGQWVSLSIQEDAVPLGSTPPSCAWAPAALWCVRAELPWTENPRHVDLVWALLPPSLWKSQGWFSADCIINAPSASHPASSQAPTPAWNDPSHRDLRFKATGDF